MAETRVPEPGVKPARPYSTLLLTAELAGVHVTVVLVQVVVPAALTPTGTAQGEHCATKLFQELPEIKVELKGMVERVSPKGPTKSKPISPGNDPALVIIIRTESPAQNCTVWVEAKPVAKVKSLILTQDPEIFCWAVISPPFQPSPHESFMYIVDVHWLAGGQSAVVTV